MSIGLVDLVNRSDVGMVERRRGFRLAQEPRLVLRIGEQMGRLSATVRPSLVSSAL